MSDFYDLTIRISCNLIEHPESDCLFIESKEGFEKEIDSIYMEVERLADVEFLLSINDLKAENLDVWPEIRYENLNLISKAVLTDHLIYKMNASETPEELEAIGKEIKTHSPEPFYREILIKAYKEQLKSLKG